MWLSVYTDKCRSGCNGEEEGGEAGGGGMSTIISTIGIPVVSLQLENRLGFLILEEEEGGDESRRSKHF